MTRAPIQLGERLPGVAASGDSPFQKFGIGINPFPRDGLQSDVYYIKHIPEQIDRMQRWLDDVHDATKHKTLTPGGFQQGPGPVPPMAIEGSIGVGKTHLLTTLERQLQDVPGYSVVNGPVTRGGMTKILLANLLLDALPEGPENIQRPDNPSSLPLIDAILVKALSDPSSMRSLERNLDRSTGNLLSAPLKHLMSRKPDDQWDRDRHILAKWLRRVYTTPNQRAALGLGSPLEAEGQAIKAISDLLRLAHEIELVQVWFVMIDQLEELWRPHVLSPGRRARFLTDLRMLVDEAALGAPIALLVAWNTRAAEEANLERFSSRRKEDDPNSALKQDYQALWQRLGEPVEIEKLGKDDIWPFAAAYLESAGVGSSGPKPRTKLYKALEKRWHDVYSRCRKDSLQTDLFNERVPARTVLRTWRDIAEELASEAG